MSESKGPYLTEGEFERNPRFGARYIYSFCALYDGALDVDRATYCPDSLLEKYAEAGVNGIWLQAVLYRVTEFPFDKKMSDGWEERQKNLRNFVNRAMVLTHKYFNGVVPALGEVTEYDRETLAELSKVRESLEYNIENYHFREALKDAMGVARLGNKYLADTEPWKVAKTDLNRVATILNISLQIAANLAIAVEPFMPFTAEKLLKMLAVDKMSWEQLGMSNLIAEGHQTAAPELLFEKIEDEVIERQVKKLEDAKAANLAANAEVPEQKESVTFDDFGKMDIRVSPILAAEKVAKTKKLLKLTVDTGIDKRTIVSGIAEHFTPEELIGRQVLVLVNLAPRELKGITSQGMILMAEDASGKLELLRPENGVNAGAIVG